MSHSSVPSSNAGAAGGAGNFKGMDCIAMYCSYFTYCEKSGAARNEIRDLDANVIRGQIEKAECKCRSYFLCAYISCFYFLCRNGSQIRNFSKA